MTYFAIFINLTKDLETSIFRDKEKLRKFSTNEYVDHPPHITLATFANPCEILLDKLAFRKTEIVVDKVEYFSDNDLNYTLYYNIKENSSLNKLHNNVVDIIEKENLKMLYPFTGPNWKPHITLAQVKNKKFAKQFSNEKYKIETTVDTLSYVKYENEKHLTLKEKKYC